MSNTIKDMESFVRPVSLRCGAWSAIVLPEFGMNVISLRCNKRPVLREPDCMETLENNPHVYGIPLLFPANRTQGAQFSFGGKTYDLILNEPLRNNHIHGLLYNAPFQVVERTDSSVTAVYENHSERYPFPFKMEINDTLNETGLHRTLTLINTGKGVLPYTLAFHTSFAAPQMFSAPIGKRFLCNEMYIPTGKMTGLTEVEKAYCTGSTSDDIRISGFYEASGHVAALDDMAFSVSDNFDEWVLFNGGGGQGFLCIEPQCGEVNGLNTVGGHRELQPNEKCEFTITIGKEVS